MLDAPVFKPEEAILAAFLLLHDGTPPRAGRQVAHQIIPGKMQLLCQEDPQDSAWIYWEIPDFLDYIFGNKYKKVI
jgi:hypothetical protein